MAKAPKRISYDLLDDNLKAMVGGESGASEPVEWSSVLNKPTTFPPSTHNHIELHSHINKAILDGITEEIINKWNSVAEHSHDEIPEHNHDNRYYTESEVNTLLNNKSNIGHTHTDISPAKHTHNESDITNLDKYTKAEVDVKVQGKSNIDHTHDGRYYTESEMNTLLGGKADKIHLHTKANISDFNHTHSYSDISSTPTIPSDTSQLNKSDVYTKGEVDGMIVDMGAGDMTKAVYDADGDGKVNASVTADSVPWDGVLNKPNTFAPSTHAHDELHIHNNKSILDMIEEAFTTELLDKLNSLVNYVHPTGDGNMHVPLNGTINTGKVLRATSTPGGIVWSTLNANDVGAAPATHSHTISQITNFPTFNRLTTGIIQPTDGYWFKVVD